uniref:DNA topoisomerase I n=1 Tax=Anopheles merus TaxID=30066 RepID=A0A182UZS7_ANOME
MSVNIRIDEARSLGDQHDQQGCDGQATCEEACRDDGDVEVDMKFGLFVDTDRSMPRNVSEEEFDFDSAFSSESNQALTDESTIDHLEDRMLPDGAVERERLKSLEDEHEILSSNLIALTSHFAQVQLRLRQIVEAPPQERDTLLKNLEEFAFLGIPEIQQNPVKQNIPEIVANLDKSPESVENLREKQQELIGQLKSQLMDLERYAYESGAGILPQTILLEKQKVIIEEIKKKINLNLNELDLPQLTSEDLRQQVDSALDELVNPLKMKEQLVTQLKTQIQDLERFISFLQTNEKAEIKKRFLEQQKQQEQRAEACKGNEGRSQRSSDRHTLSKPMSAHPSNGTSASQAAAKRESFNSKAFGLMDKAGTLLQMFALSQFTCGSEHRNSETNYQSKMMTRTRQNCWGDIRARLEYDVQEIASLALTMQNEISPKEADHNDEEDEDSNRPGRDNRKNYELTLLVRKRLAKTIQRLMQHGLRSISESASHSLVPFISGCFSTTGSGHSGTNHSSMSSRANESFYRSEVRRKSTGTTTTAPKKQSSYVEEDTSNAVVTEDNLFSQLDDDEEEDMEPQFDSNNKDEMHVWELLLVYYNIKNGDRYNSTPARKLSESFNLDIVDGNICRSPIAEAVFIKAIDTAGVADQWEVDSAAIGSWHVGRSPDHRALATMKKHDLPYSNKARQIKKADFEHYDYIFGMDGENIADLKERAPKGDSKAKILLLGDFDPQQPGAIIRDPYYDSGSEGFEQCYVQCDSSKVMNGMMERPNGVSNGHSGGGGENGDRHKSHKSSSKDKHRDKDRDKNRDKDKHRDKDRDREKDKNRDKHKSSSHSSSSKSGSSSSKDKEKSDKEKHSSSSSSNKDKEKSHHSSSSSHKSSKSDKDRSKDKEREKDKHRSREDGKDRERDRDKKDRDKSSRSDKDKDKHKSSSSSSSNKDKDRDKHKSSSSSSSRDKDKDKNKHSSSRRDKDKHSSSSSSSKHKDRHRDEKVPSGEVKVKEEPEPVPTEFLNGEGIPRLLPQCLEPIRQEPATRLEPARLDELGWEEEKRDDGVKWKYLEHKGPVFAPPYDPLPSHVKFMYDGKEMKLSQDAEEVAGFYARMLEHDYTSKQAFNDNFFKDWRKTMTPHERERITDLEKCNFRPMAAYFAEMAEQNRNRSKEEKAALKAANEQLTKEYGICVIDGHKEKIGNFKIEPPGLFRGRGEHPKMGLVKRRVMPEDVIINCSQDSKIPSPPPGRRWKEVRHDNTVSWLASWVENVQGQVKYIMLNPSSKLKGEKDWQKYETARRLLKHIDKIRDTYRDEWKSKEMRIRQRAVAMYFIDKLALRAGNEKDDDQADTVGCCSLRYEHIALHKELNGKENVVVFDFLGKDSIRYYNEVEVEKRVFKNLELFKENKKPGDDLFDRLNTSVVNEYLKGLMDGLTAKVFRTFNASYTLQKQLEELTDPNMSVPEKLLAYNRANRAVAILCNHQRAVPKTHEKSMGNLKEKIRVKREQVEQCQKEFKDLKKSNVRDPSAFDKKSKQLERLKEQLKKLELQETDRDENKTIALGTSKLNYLDPRISVAWCKKFGVPIEKIFNKTQRDKFRWAIDMADENYVF